jgi:hypothetical protein
MLGRLSIIGVGWVSERRKKPLDRKRSLRIVGIGLFRSSSVHDRAGAGVIKLFVE